MAKAEIAIAMKEMKRILRRNGLLYVNITSTDDSRFSARTRVIVGKSSP